MTTFPTTATNHDLCKKVTEVLGRIGDKWTMLVIAALYEKPRRFNDLKRQTGGISQQMLTRTLRSLERDGMITRTVHPTVPPQVEYALTSLGYSLSKPVMQLGLWAMENISIVEWHRRKFDSRKQ